MAPRSAVPAGRRSAAEITLYKSVGVAVQDLETHRASDKRLRTTSTPHPVPSLSDTLLLERDLLDQQIIDVDGRKVVRVNDVNATVPRVKEQGGQVLNGPMEVPGGDLIAQCLDPQGAAFAIHSKKPA